MTSAPPIINFRVRHLQTTLAEKHSIVAIAIAVVAAILMSSSISAAPRIAFNENGATATGIRRGGDAVWFVHSVSEFSGSPMLSRKVEVTPDEDRDGNVALVSKVRPSSVWVVVDLATGEYAIARPDGETAKTFKDREDAWAPGRPDLDFDLSHLDVLVVRPGRGVWALRSEQGGSGDGDRRADGNLRVSLGDMEKIYGSTPAPLTALPLDLFVGVEPYHLNVFVREAKEVKP